MSLRRVPPLKGLRAFDAVARHLSFTRAAEELSLTTTAVSHRVRNLESWLEVKLFERKSNSIVLTREGEIYLPKIRQAFELIDAAQKDLDQKRARSHVNISTTMSFASNWLLPRLGEFKEKASYIDIHLEATDLRRDLLSGNPDIAVRYGNYSPESDDNFIRQKVVDDWSIAVCTPQMAESLKRPEDILEHTCIEYRWNQYSESDPSWAKWLKVAGLTPVSPPRLEIFNEEHMAIQHALSGRSIALVGRVAASIYLSEGRLIQPFPYQLKNKTYYVEFLESNSEKTALKSFSDWLVCQARDSFGEW
ncbi:LysR family transcriptional regulator [Marinobacter sp. F4206]|uniref:LysR family transcriptional regulator n=1 Tax=Marinobacter sp. F4206 TaxID=2861777 RepID=UPI001C603F76|nr:LysR family transcriptional regulator [Marinobacter sp. F4206]MBW4933161.1 LysR family transcriptional regulator [Marinobacter sp. F4206]